MRPPTSPTLEAVWTANLLAVPPEVLDTLPDPPAGRPDPPRIRGMLWGLAVGDSLGNMSESLRPDQRQALYGEIRDYIANRLADGRHVGLPSDDTQLAFWTLEHLLEHGRLDPAALAATFASRPIFGLGATVTAFLRAYKSGAPWYEAGQPSAGNGAAMRIAPILVPHLGRPSKALWRDAIVCGAITHDDPSSAGACAGLVALLWDLVHGLEPAGPEWWLDRYIELARPVEGDVPLRPRRRDLDYEGPIWRFVDTVVRDTLRADVPTRQACDSWYSAAFLLETIPCVLYILARHGDDPEEAIVRAVNDTWDNDTVGAIVGAVVGARHGEESLPARWREGLLGRTGMDDDGRVQELIESLEASE